MPCYTDFERKPIPGTWDRQARQVYEWVVGTQHTPLPVDVNGQIQGGEPTPDLLRDDRVVRPIGIDHIRIAKDKCCSAPIVDNISLPWSEHSVVRESNERAKRARQKEHDRNLALITSSRIKSAMFTHSLLQFFPTRASRQYGTGDETPPPVDPNNISSPSPTPIKDSTKFFHISFQLSTQCWTNDTLCLSSTHCGIHRSLLTCCTGSSGAIDPSTEHGDGFNTRPDSSSAPSIYQPDHTSPSPRPLDE